MAPKDDTLLFQGLVSQTDGPETSWASAVTAGAGEMIKIRFESDIATRWHASRPSGGGQYKPTYGRILQRRCVNATAELRGLWLAIRHFRSRRGRLRRELRWSVNCGALRRDNVVRGM